MTHFYTFSQNIVRHFSLCCSWTLERYSSLKLGIYRRGSVSWGCAISQMRDTLFPCPVTNRKIPASLFHTAPSTSKDLYRCILHDFCSSKTVAENNNFGK